MREFATIFLALMFETTPFLLAGVLISVFAGPLIEKLLAAAAFRVPVVGLVAGASAGMLLPMCDCGTRPLAHRLALAGRRDFAVAFMVAAPVINPVVVLTTWLAFRDPTLLALRLGITLVIALVVGVVVGALKADIALPAAASDHEHGTANFGDRAERSLDEFFELFRFLVIGSLLAAAVQHYVDTSALSTAQDVYLSIAGMMLLSFLLSICSSVDAFVVAGLGAGLGLGPMLAFLVFGPIVNLKSAPLYFRLFSVPAVLLLAAVVTQLAFVSAAVVELRMVKQGLIGLGAAMLGLALAVRISDGSVHALVQSWYTPILELSALILVLLGSIVAVRAIRNRQGAAEHFSLRSGVNIALVAAPLVLALLLKPEPLGGKNLDKANGGGQPQFSRVVGSADPVQRNVYQWAYSFATDPPASLVGQAVDVTGFVHHGKTDQGDRFSIARFVVACCVADAAGYTLPVQWKTADALKDDGWIRVKGKVALGSLGQPIVQAESIDQVTTPDNPYIYP